MSDDFATKNELALSLSSIAESNRTMSRCLEKLAASVAVIETYMIHNDYRHTAAEDKVEAIETDVASILEIMEERKPFWSMLKRSKLAVGALITGALAMAGGSIYSYVFRPKPAINQHKEQIKATVKPVTKDLIK